MKNLIFKKEKALILAYDHGMEHGPKEFNLTNVDPEHIVEIAIKGKYSALACQQGIAKYYVDHHRKRVPLIVKLNGKTNIPQIEPVSLANCSVKRAVDLRADAVGYTIYLGSEYEKEMLKEFGKIVEEAHDYLIPVMAWIYPRGRFVHDELHTDVLAYAARVGLELGADAIKLKYNSDKEGFKWVVKSAGKAKVMVAGGPKVEGGDKFLREVKDFIEAGASGMAVGRNVWKSDKPLKVTKALKAIIFDGAKVKEALKWLK